MGERFQKGSKNLQAKLTEKQVKQIFVLYNNERWTQARIAEHFNVNQAHISRILKGERFPIGERSKRTRRNLKPRQIELIKTLYFERDWNIKELAKQFERTEEHLKVILNNA